MTRTETDVVVESFGDEWSRFDQQGIDIDLVAMFNSYFRIFPWTSLPASAEGFDLGCGSGRWARFVAPRCAKLYCIEPSKAIDIAKANLQTQKNVYYIRTNVRHLSLPEQYFDFGYCLGVLHHTDDVQYGINKVVASLKPGAPFLLYLYYRFEHRPLWFRALWQSANFLRRLIAPLPFEIKCLFCDAIAFFVYLPLARLAGLMQRLGAEATNLPLHIYRNRSFYVMRTDALDRFGTKVEKRFTKAEIREMMEKSGLINIQFSDQEPYWCALGYKN